MTAQEKSNSPEPSPDNRAAQPTQPNQANQANQGGQGTWASFWKNWGPWGWREYVLVAFIILVVLIGAYGAFRFFTEPSEVPQSVNVTNMADRSFTVSWMTREKATKGYVIVSEKDSFTPVISRVFGDKRRDERDLLVDKWNEVFGTNRRYYTHIVHIEDLEPEKEYFIRIGSGNRLYGEDKDEGSDWVSVWTLETLEETVTPDPAYGRVLRENGEDPAPGALVFMQLKKENGDKSTLLSGLTKENGTWVIETSNARTSDGKKAFGTLDSEDEEIMWVDTEVRGQAREVKVDPDDDQPAPDITLAGDKVSEYLEEQNRPMRRFTAGLVNGVRNVGNVRMGKYVNVEMMTFGLLAILGASLLLNRKRLKYLAVLVAVVGMMGQGGVVWGDVDILDDELTEPEMASAGEVDTVEEVDSDVFDEIAYPGAESGEIELQSNPEVLWDEEGLASDDPFECDQGDEDCLAKRAETFDGWISTYAQGGDPEDVEFYVDLEKQRIAAKEYAAEHFPGDKETLDYYFDKVAIASVISWGGKWEDVEILKNNMKMAGGEVNYYEMIERGMNPVDAANLVGYFQVTGMAPSTLLNSDGVTVRYDDDNWGTYLAMLNGQQSEHAINGISYTLALSDSVRIGDSVGADAGEVAVDALVIPEAATLQYLNCGEEEGCKELYWGLEYALGEERDRLYFQAMHLPGGGDEAQWFLSEGGTFLEKGVGKPGNIILIVDGKEGSAIELGDGWVTIEGTEEGDLVCTVGYPEGVSGNLELEGEHIVDYIILENWFSSERSPSSDIDIGIRPKAKTSDATSLQWQRASFSVAQDIEVEDSIMGVSEGLVSSVSAQEGDPDDSDSINVRFYLDKNGNQQREEDEPWLTDEDIEVSYRQMDYRQTYDLKQGWNMFSFPMVFDEQLNASTLLGIIASADGYATTVSTYQSGRWITYKQRGDVKFSDEDFPIIPGRGYFIRVIKPVTIELKGKLLEESASIDLSYGWNMIGVHPGWSSDGNSKWWEHKGENEDWMAVDLMDKMREDGLEASVVTDYVSGRYESVIKDEDNSGQLLVYGRDYGLEEKKAYFVRIDSEGKVWRP